MRQCSHWYRGTVNDGVSAEHDVLVKKRRATGASTDWRRVRRGGECPAGLHAGLGAAAARLEGARPGIPELGPG
jgi:hypothetical protein